MRTKKDFFYFVSVSKCAPKFKDLIAPELIEMGVDFTGAFH